MSSSHDFLVAAHDVVPNPRCRPTLIGIATHYEVLGVDADATPEAIRAAYRRRARLEHPDHRPHGTADTMAVVNEAYRVLGDPARRLDYDRSIGRRGSAAGAQQPVPVDTEGRAYAPPPPPPSRMMPAGPARVPWKMMAITAVIGSAVVLVAAAFTDPPSTEPPDGILRVGSCVSIEPNLDVREIACTGSDADVVVELVIPTDATCPVGLAEYRDRLGLGNVCIEQA